MKRVYLAGPMNGYPEKNFPMFIEAAAKLREAGFEVISPAENPIPDHDLKTWQGALTYDIQECVCPVDGVAVLPGFEQSKGACLEIFVALALGKSVELVPGQPESWRTRVLEWGRMSLASVWRDVNHGNYDETHQQIASVLRGATRQAALENNDE